MTDLMHHLRGGGELNPLPVSMIECGCCDHHHREDFYGDCRNDSQRFIEQDDRSGPSDYVDEDGELWISAAYLRSEVIV